MTISTARWVLFIGLLLILPLPFYAGHWAILPTANELLIVLRFLLAEGAEFYGLNGLLLVQGLAGVFICWLLALLYGVSSSQWPSKIRGSIVGLSLLTALILFSSAEVYRSLESATLPLTFMQLY